MNDQKPKSNNNGLPLYYIQYNGMYRIFNSFSQQVGLCFGHKMVFNYQGAIREKPKDEQRAQLLRPLLTGKMY